MRDTDRELLEETVALRVQMLATLANLDRVLDLVAARAEKAESKDDQEEPVD